LGSLSREEAGELLEQAARRPLEARLIDAMHEESGGNPFFLGELGRHVRRDLDGEASLPESIRAAVGLRLAGLSEQTQHVLQLASVFTAGFGFVPLEALTELDEASLLNCIEQALAEELIRPLNGERYDFAHALVRQTLYERLSPSRRARLHRRLAEALERLHEDDPAQVARELVHQYHASATLPGARRGVTHALIAGRRARAGGAPVDAVMVLRLGRDLVGADEVDTRARVVSELALAEADAGLFEDASQTLQTAIALLEEGGVPGEAIAELVFTVGSTFASAVAMQSLEAIEPLVARALAAIGHTHSLSWARLKLLHRFDRPQTVGSVHALRPVRLDPEAVRIARSEGTEADYAFAIDASDPPSAAEIEQLIARIDVWRDPVARLRALIIVVGWLTLGRPGSSPATDRLCWDLASLADDVGLLPQRALARVYLAAHLGGRGEFDAAAERIGQAWAMFERQSPSGAIPGLVTLVAELNAQHVAVDWSRVAVVMLDLASSPGDAAWFSLASAALAAQAFASAGDVARAREVLDQLLRTLASAELFEPLAIGLAAGAVWQLRARDLAEQLLPRALALADADGHEFYMTSTELTVARLSAVLGRFDRAAEYFERARVTLERRDQRVLRAIVDYDEALARLEHRQPGAARLLAAARGRFEELGMCEWSRRAALLKVAADRELPDGLTTREAEVLRLVAVRKTNKEIAAELVLSVHTVERHVQNAYRKISARNRADAGTYVARVGL
jgi:DNA-binding CsgD family transcriptional regulator/tetratricopeptide (TPR) repeat protein